MPIARKGNIAVAFGPEGTGLAEQLEIDGFEIDYDTFMLRREVDIWTALAVILFFAYLPFELLYEKIKSIFKR